VSFARKLDFSEDETCNNVVRMKLDYKIEQAEVKSCNVSRNGSHILSHSTTTVPVDWLCTNPLHTLGNTKQS